MLYSGNKQSCMYSRNEIVGKKRGIAGDIIKSPRSEIANDIDYCAPIECKNGLVMGLSNTDPNEMDSVEDRLKTVVS